MEYHKLVQYDAEYHSAALGSLGIVSNLLWKIEKALPDMECSSVSTNTIRIVNATKEEYHHVIKALGLNIGEKEASDHNILVLFEVDGIQIRFLWDLPETCEVTYEETPIPEDEIIRVRKTVKEVICEKPLMQSVFPDWTEEENGNTE